VSNDRDFVPNFFVAGEQDMSAGLMTFCVDQVVEGGGSSRAVTRLHTMIGITEFRPRDLLRIRRALYRLTEKS
jgi:hypothetical protein